MRFPSGALSRVVIATTPSLRVSWAQMKFAPHRGEIAAQPTSLMKSRRLNRSSLCQGDKIAEWERSSQGRAAVRILTRLLTGLGHTRSFGDVGSMSGLPESGHDWPIY